MDSTAQKEEVEALKAIYDTDFHTVSADRPTYSISVWADVAVGDQQLGGGSHAHSHSQSCASVELQLMFPEDYPSSSPPVYTIRAPWLGSTEIQIIADNFSTIYSEDQGEVVVYRWVEWVREFITQRARQLQEDLDGGETKSPAVASEGEDRREDGSEDLASGDEEEVQTDRLLGDTVHSAVSSRSQSGEPSADMEVLCPTIIHGEPLTDRKSTFQAHVAAVTCVAEVKAVLAELKSSRKIATATHNILAYRVYVAGRGAYLQDCDDDGESAAGGRLLHLLQIMDVRNVMVVVTRWFGGILLHSDRFKHINNVARILLQESGVGLEHKERDVGKKKGKSKAGRHR